MPVTRGMFPDIGELEKEYAKLFIDSNGNPLERGLYEIVPKVTPLLFTGDFVEQGAVFLDYQGIEYTFSREKLLSSANRFTKEGINRYIDSLQNLISWIELHSQTLPKYTDVSKCAWAEAHGER